MDVRSSGKVSVVVAVVAGLLACGGGEPVQDATVLTPVPDIPVPAEPPSPDPDFVGVGRGDLPAPVGDAIEGLFREGRWVRCAIPVDVDTGSGPLSAVRIGTELTWLLGPTIQDGWFAASVSAPDGKAIVRRDDHTVAQLTWRDAGRGGWTECTIASPVRFQILGIVQDAEGDPIGGATIRGCEPGESVVANEIGRFTLQGVAFAPCPLLAIVQDADGLGKSEEEAVVSDGADTIVEITVPPERLPAEAWDEAAKNLHGVIERAYRNGVGADLENLKTVRAAAVLPPRADDVVAVWVTDLERRNTVAQEALGNLGKGGRDGLVAFWLADY